MVGDKMLDVRAGQSAGCKTILLRRALSEQAHKSGQPPTCSAADLSEALDIILRSELLK
jgi:phosphoglycolate phosphatase-like HAD superfamily hydrolase